MSPPCFADLGKDARDVFIKNYYFGLMKLECKSKTKSGVEFNINGTSNNDNGRISASLETKYKYTDHGLTLKEKWNTDNNLITELIVEDKFAKGLKLDVGTSFIPQTGQKNGFFNLGFKNDIMNVNADAEHDSFGLTFKSGAVLEYQGWLAGAFLSLDATKNKLSKTSFAVGYKKDDIVFHTNVNDGTEFEAAIYHKARSNLKSAVQLGWLSNTNTAKCSFGCVYEMDNDTSFRVKVNNSSHLGLSFTHTLKEGIQLTLSTLIEGKNLNQGGHKIGVGLNLEA